MGEVAHVLWVWELHPPGEGVVGLVWGHVGRVALGAAMVAHIPSHTSPAHSTGSGISVRVEQWLQALGGGGGGRGREAMMCEG